MPRNVFGMITTEKSTEYTWHALASFFAHTKLERDDTFLLIDNDAGSLDAERLKREFPQVQFRMNPAPMSFAANMNQAMRLADEMQADVYLLNNDLIFTPNWLVPLLAEQRWIVSPVSNAQYQYRAGGLNFELTMKLTDFLTHRDEFDSIVEQHCKAHQGYRMVPTLPYYCVKIPRSVYSDVGFLDETYSRGGFEDSDYTVRCLEKAIPVYYALGSFVLHFYGKSSWTADSGPLFVDPDPKIGKRGDLMFRKRWGEGMTEMFALQSPDGQRQLKELETRAIFGLYVHLAREARKFRDAQGEILDP